MNDHSQLKLLIPLLPLLAMSQLVSAAPPPGATLGAPPRSAPANGQEAAAYSLGLTFGTQLNHSGVKEGLPTEPLLRGIQDGLHGKAATSEDKLRVAAFLRSAKDVVGSNNSVEAQQFLAKNKKAPGVTTLPSGLQYKILAAGTAGAASPKPTDQVTVQYRGRLLNGTEFDSSYKHGKAATFRVDSVIKGWQEALPLMKPGAKWELFVSPELAYGLNTPGAIPPGSLLVFDIELVKVDGPASADSPAGNAATPTPPQS
jgi:FKBP-type peptidyl-prolyl cis-trans isomerase FklB